MPEKKAREHGPAAPNFSELEIEVLERWRRDNIFQKTLDQTKKGRPFVFFEGPPTANGQPGIHHVLARAYKDVIPRFRTMQGFHVERKAGWDTHGLPVELEVEKQLGLKSKKDIEKYGIEKFNAECKKSVWQYKSDWEKLTERIGFWLDLEHPYITYDPDYVESLWWIIKQIWDKKLLYQGHKVVPQCPRCGTALSSHEVAQGYKEVKENSVYVKFKVKSEKGKVKKGDYILSWTTTPWTLPGNVALAINTDEKYGITKPNNKGERFIISIKLVRQLLGGPDLISQSNEGADIEFDGEVIKGADLEDLEYEPLFPVAIPKSTPGYENAFKVYKADFVTTNEGTGIVHTAVMYGEDDYALGEKVNLPKHHTVTEDGKFTDDVKPWAGQFVKDKKVEQGIVDYLRANNLLYKEEAYTHDYPFCWRCDSPLLYYAKTSWFIKMSSLKEELRRNNEEINWIPEHIKHGRFGEWLNEVKDWAFSRERYWGTPLPIWVCEKNSEHKLCVGSYDELTQHSKDKTEVYLVRHGESETQLEDVTASWPESRPYHLTERGRQAVEKIAQSLKHKSINLIISSDLTRTKETAEILKKVLQVPVEYDERLREISYGSLNGRPNSDYYQQFTDLRDRFDKQFGDCETLRSVRQRMLAALNDIRRKYPGQKVVIVSHGDPLWMLLTGLKGLSDEASLEANFPEMGTVRELTLGSLPLDNQGRPDPHRPFVDEVILNCPDCGSGMRRVKELCDVWFDSGSMPFAQWHYQGKTGTNFDHSYPADYIAEAIDQTRGWFYTLLAVATLLDKGAPYKNVICLGHILDAKGQKMSKSKGNVVDPWSVIDQYGADALRFHLFSINQPGEYKLFDPKQVGDSLRQNFMILWNVVSFWEQFKPEKEADYIEPAKRSKLDQWQLAQLNRLVEKVTASLEAYQITDSARSISEFITELSTWYVRRSRARFKIDGADRDAAYQTLTESLFTLTKLLAPFTPLVADALYHRLGGRLASVHLEAWPNASGISEDAAQRELIRQMSTVRQIVELGHSLRAEAGVKVRQPLGQLVFKGAQLSEEFNSVLLDELNVREVVPSKTLPQGVDWKCRASGALSVALDTTITDELREAGWVREVIRRVNDERKRLGLDRTDLIRLSFHSPDETVKGFFERYGPEVSRAVNAEKIVRMEAGDAQGAEFKLDGHPLTLLIQPTKR